jgi:hypothetical protein
MLPLPGAVARGGLYQAAAADTRCLGSLLLPPLALWRAVVPEDMWARRLNCADVLDAEVLLLPSSHD